MELLPINHTFVVCAHGESPFLDECVRSIVTQTEKSNVLIATSTLNAHIQSIAERYHVPLFVNTVETDMQASWNFGISCAQTDFVTVCHQDDLYAPEYYQFVGQALSDDTLFIHTNYLDLSENGCFRSVNNLVRSILNFPLQFSPFQRSVLFKKTSLRFGNAICCPTCTYNVSRIGQPVFTSSLKHSCDWDLYVTLASREGRMIYLPQPLVRKRIHELSSTAADILSGLREKEDRYMFRRLWPASVAEIILSIYKHIYKYSL